MNKYLVLTADGQSVKVLANGASVRDGALCFHANKNNAECFVVAYAPGCWKFFGLLDVTGDVPNIEE
jgi:hypothetical protein